MIYKLSGGGFCDKVKLLRDNFRVFRFLRVMHLARQRGSRTFGRTRGLSRSPATGKSNVSGQDIQSQRQRTVVYSQRAVVQKVVVKSQSQRAVVRYSCKIKHEKCGCEMGCAMEGISNLREAQGTGSVPCNANIQCERRGQPTRWLSFPKYC